MSSTALVTHIVAMHVDVAVAWSRGVAGLIDRATEALERLGAAQWP